MIGWTWTREGLEEYAEQARQTSYKAICPKCGSKLQPTCLGCGARFSCTNEDCDYEDKCGCTDFE